METFELVDLCDNCRRLIDSLKCVEGREMDPPWCFRVVGCDCERDREFWRAHNESVMDEAMRPYTLYVGFSSQLPK